MKNLLEHQTKREELFKFLILISILAGYFLYLSWKFDLATGGMVSILTWSFFVLCTPVADAGFLIDFPVRILTGLRMFYTELIVWGLAISVNILGLSFAADSYDKSFLTSLFYKILTTPWPYWTIIVLCAIGTFLSIRFGDEMLDVVSHKHREYHHKHSFKHKMIAMAALIFIIVIAYYHLIASLGVEIP